MYNLESVEAIYSRFYNETPVLMQNFKYENGLYCKGDIIESSLWPFMASLESIKFQPFDDGLLWGAAQ